MLSVLQMKYWTSIDWRACSTSQARASSASRAGVEHEHAGLAGLGGDLRVDELPGLTVRGGRGRHGEAGAQGQHHRGGPALQRCGFHLRRSIPQTRERIP